MYSNLVRLRMFIWYTVKVRWDETYPWGSSCEAISLHIPLIVAVESRCFWETKRKQWIQAKNECSLDRSFKYVDFITAHEMFFISQALMLVMKKVFILVCLNWLTICSNPSSWGSSRDIPAYASSTLHGVNNLQRDLCSLLSSTATHCSTTRQLGQSQLPYIRFTWLIGAYARETLWTCSKNSPIKYVLLLKRDPICELGSPFSAKLNNN